MYRRSMRSAASTASGCCSKDAAPTGAILTDVLGFSEVGREENLVRFKAATPRSAASSICMRRAGLSAGTHGRRLGASHRVPRRRR